jgi:hypothetical protein
LDTDWDLEIIMDTILIMDMIPIMDTIIIGGMIRSITIAGIRLFASTLIWVTDGGIIITDGTATTTTTMDGTAITIIMAIIITDLLIIPAMTIMAVIIIQTGILPQLTPQEEARETMPDLQTIPIIMEAEE